ncbi:MAG: AMP-binding protein [Streptosporangiales bacterium]|nr:AMP-binding protein [Streptosporangiales bacterium]
MSSYRDRPWLAQYEPGRPADITAEFPDGLTMWRSTAEKAADRPFLYYFDAALSAGQLDRDSDALAVAFAARGVRRGDRVVLYLQNVPQFVIGMLAAWKLGAVTVSANPMLKQRELNYVLADCGAKAIISLQDLWNSVAAKAVEDTDVAVAVTTSPLDYVEDAACLGGEIPPVFEGLQRLDTPDALDLVDLVRESAGRRPDPVSLTAEDVALLTYTSGTTGEPKGAMNTHGNVVFNACTYREWMSLTPRDVLLAGAPLFHITGLIGHIAVSVLVPMPMVFGYRFEPATINRLVERHRCTFTIMAITAFTAMMNDPSIRTCDMSSLTKVYSGGAPIAPSIVERFEREVGPYIHNAYGLTETTSPTHFVPFGARSPVDPTSGALSVGVPVFNVAARVVDNDGRDVPVGEVGEIAMSGPMVAPGYWNKPEVTASTFPDGELRSGDVGFMDADGWFYIVDRKKDMIVASGYKVWPREVEDVLLEHPAVREAAVVGVPDPYRGETVWAYVSLRPGKGATSDELVGFCRERLAAYKYPRRIEILDDLPKNPSGKLLRRELRDWAREAGS